MENASIPASFDLAGVPTFCILDIKGEKIYSLKFFLLIFRRSSWYEKNAFFCSESQLIKGNQKPNII